MKARLSVSLIDWWLGCEDNTLEQLQHKLDHREPDTEAKLRSVAFHRAIEKIAQAGDGQYNRADADGFSFDFSDFEVDFDQFVASRAELKLEVPLLLDSHELTLVAKVNRLAEGVVEDHKTTSHFDAERLRSGWQWKFSLWLARADVFRWHVYEMTPAETPRKAFKAWLDRFDDWRDNPPAEELVRGLRRYKVTGYQQLEVGRYDGLEDDCRGALRGFLRAVELLVDHDLIDPERIVVPED